MVKEFRASKNKNILHAPNRFWKVMSSAEF